MAHLWTGAQFHGEKGLWESWPGRSPTDWACFRATYDAERNRKRKTLAVASSLKGFLSDLGLVAD